MRANILALDTLKPSAWSAVFAMSALRIGNGFSLTTQLTSSFTAEVSPSYLKMFCRRGETARANMYGSNICRPQVFGAECGGWISVSVCSGSQHGVFLDAAADLKAFWLASCYNSRAASRTAEW
ncbi:hypothetical protein Anapl_07655 [Anas platyrhynchos]|uniref:Uncharacterized protein n=1 Tax=Anas platyrhynchos TaxID=8839 RepID=R0LNM8_ANAPL|nr:hypothetical protein Anapl_07655 [Anas platyrhynchos]